MKSITQKLHGRDDLHLARKLWHILGGLTGFYIYENSSASPLDVGLGLMIFSIVNLLIELLRLRVQVLNNAILKVMGPFMRESERSELSGLPFYTLGIGIALYFFDEQIATLAILFLIFSDPFSSLVGILYGKDKIMPNKSLQGSSGGFICCFFITMLYGIQNLQANSDLIVFSIFAGIIGSLSELCSVVVDDNLTIPVVSALGLTLLNYFVPLF